MSWYAFYWWAFGALVVLALVAGTYEDHGKEGFYDYEDRP